MIPGAEGRTTIKYSLAGNYLHSERLAVALADAGQNIEAVFSFDFFLMIPGGNSPWLFKTKKYDTYLSRHFGRVESG